MTSQKTEKKRISSKIFVALAALTLVSCCFLGTTFARYTTGTTSGSAGADIADWEIVVTDGNTSGSVADDFLVISPVGEAHDSDERVNTIEGSGAVITITNKGQVNAEVKVTVSSTKTYWVKDYKMNGAEVVIENGRYAYTEKELVNGQTYHDQEGREYTWDGTNCRPLYSVTGVGTASDEWETYGLDDVISVGALSIVGAESPATIVLGNDDSITLAVAGATWTSDFTGEDGSDGDARDTWIGENVLKVGYTFTWEAVQTDAEPTV